MPTTSDDIVLNPALFEGGAHLEYELIYQIFTKSYNAHVAWLNRMHAIIQNQSTPVSVEEAKVALQLNAERRAEIETTRNQVLAIRSLTLSQLEKSRNRFDSNSLEWASIQKIEHVVSESVKGVLSQLLRLETISEAKRTHLQECKNVS